MVKGDLRKEGYDIRQCTDPVYAFAWSKEFVSMDESTLRHSVGAGWF